MAKKELPEIRLKTLEWLFNGESGASSKALAACICGINGGSCPPSDRDDFERCMGYFKAVPEAKKYLSMAKCLNHEWRNIIDHWDKLEELCKYDKEHGTMKTYSYLRYIQRDL